MAALLDNLLPYVRTGTAESDRKMLDHLFIKPAQFDQLCAIEPGGMRLLTGTKGIGKSAVVEWLAKISKKQNLPCLLIRPDNIVGSATPAVKDIGSLKSYYYEILVRTIAAQIGSQLKGFLTGPAAKLYNEARQRKMTDGDFVSKALELVTAISVPVSKIDGVKLGKDLAGENSPTSLIGAINQQLLSSGNVFYLLIDDTDQLAAPSEAEHLNRIWALLLAVRRLVGECEDIRAIVTLRSSVWARMASESVGQRDQTDHLRGFVVALRAEDNLMKDIIRRRLTRAAKDFGKTGDPYSVFFKGVSVNLPTSTEVRPWETFILKSARERPRDAIQLIKNMIDVAKDKTKPLGGDEADKGMQSYSKERVDDIVNEFSLDCANIRNIIDSFTAVAFELEFEPLRAHLVTVPSGSSTNIRGEVIQPQSNEGSVKILALLHESGFINARVLDDRAPKGFRHILFQDDPYFVRWDNWNDMQAATWEVHPAFRTYLLGVRKAELARRSIVASR